MRSDVYDTDMEPGGGTATGAKVHSHSVDPQKIAVTI